MMGVLRSELKGLMQAHGLLHLQATWSALWITDFPLFEIDRGDPDEACGEDGRRVRVHSIASAHHPFTSPHPDDMEPLLRLLQDGV